MEKNYKVEGMHCVSCQNIIEKEVRNIKGVQKANINFSQKRLNIICDNTVTDEKVISKITEAGYNAIPAADDITKEDLDNINETQKTLRKFKKSLIFALPVFLIAMLPMIMHMLNIHIPDFLSMEKNGICLSLIELLLTIPVIIINKETFISGFKNLFKLHPNMDSLISVGSSAAFLYSVFLTIQIVFQNQVHELYYESVGTILTLIVLGKYFEAKSQNQTSKALKKLISLIPQTATIIIKNKQKQISSNEIKVGDKLLVKPGEKFSVDGIIIEGSTEVDESLITGESLPVLKTQNENVVGGEVNLTKVVTYKATKTLKDSSLSQIIKLVADASKEKAPIAKLADVISSYFVPSVIIIATLSALIWLFIGQSIPFALTIFVSVLIIACPCALGLATPTAIMVSAGKGAENGILIKNGQTLEKAHSIKTAVFDKTGTLTMGKPEILDIFTFDFEKEKLLEIAASIESLSNHPLSKAIVSKVNTKKYLKVKDFEDLPGYGVKGKIDKNKILIGNESLMKENNIKIPGNTIINKLTSQGKTPIFISLNNKLIGILSARDEINKTAKQAIQTLNKMNIETIMLTGDHENVAKAIAKKLNIKKVYAGVKPEEKYQVIKNLQKEGKTVAMVGDGINDAIALTGADIGIAVSKGTDIASSSANIILVKDDLNGVPEAILLSKKTIKIIKTNLFWALFYNVIGILFATGAFYNLGLPLLNPMIAALAMSLSSICIIANTLRLNRVKLS